MKKYIISLIIILLAYYINAQETTNEQLKKQLDNAAKKSLSTNKIHGLSYCVVLPGGNILTTGLGKQTNSQAIDSTMRWMFASCTKNIVAAEILALQEEGKLKLDDLVSKYFTHPNIDCNYSIKDLLQHQTNYGKINGTPKYFNEVVNNSVKIWKPNEILNKLVKKADSKSTDFQYRNTNYLILAIIIEKIAGKSLNEELKTRFFDKLGMNSTSMAMEGYNFKQLAGAWFDTNRDGTVDDLSQFGSETLNARLSIAFGSGNIISTPKDMAVWAKSLYTGKVLSEPSLKEMKTLAKNSGPHGVFKGYGIGMEHICTGPYNHLGHSGKGIHVSSMFYNPELNIAIAVVLNEDCQDSMRQLHMEVFKLVEKYCSALQSVKN